MRRLIPLSFAVILATCQPGDVADVGPAGEDVATALLALDLDRIFAGDSGATAIRLHVDGQQVAQLPLIGNGALEGFPTVAVAASGRHEVVLELVGKPGLQRSLAHTLDAGPDEVVRLLLQSSGAGRPHLTALPPERLSDRDGATVDYLRVDRGQAHLPRLGATPAQAVAAMLADPQIAVLTPLGEAAAIGPLVAWPAAHEPEAMPTSAPATVQAPTSSWQGLPLRRWLAPMTRSMAKTGLRSLPVSTSALPDVIRVCRTGLRGWRQRDVDPGRRNLRLARRSRGGLQNRRGRPADVLD